MEHSGVCNAAVKKACWSTFLHESIGVPACPILFQYVVYHIFHIFIKRHHQFDKAEENIDVRLNYEEQNALRYTAGYVTRALIKKLKHSAHPLKEEMVCCLLELREDVPEHESED